MKIHYKNEDRSVYIDDSLRMNYGLVLLLLVLNVFQAVARFFNKQSGMEYLWMIIGSISLLGIIYFLLRKSLKNKIKKSEIDSFRNKFRFGKITYFIKLKNGKSRDLNGLKTEAEVEKVVSFFRELDVEIKLRD